MVLWHVENFAIAQQVDLKVGDFALFLNPEGEVFHGCDVGTIGPSFEGTPIPAGSEPLISAIELELQGGVAAMRLLTLRLNLCCCRIYPSGPNICVFHSPPQYC
jgi:hypothetical protein